MSTVYSPLAVHNLWRSVGTDSDRELRSRATGAEVTESDAPQGLVDIDLSAVLWPILSRLNVTHSSVAQLVERIRSLMAPGGFGPGGLPLDTLWSSTAYGLKLDVNYPANLAISTRDDQSSPAEQPEASHARLARELRALTGLPAAVIGASLGVTREQYQRWVAGSSISDTRHGQLIYLHTVAVDVARRLGQPMARLWWKTPVEAGVTPEELLKRRRADRVYRLAAAIPDPAPIAGGLLRGLPLQDGRNDEPDEGADRGEAWSPYGESRD